MNIAQGVVAVAALVSLLVCGCSKRAKIADVTKPATVHLTTGDANVHRLDVRVRGELVGAAMLVGVDFTQRVSGNFDIAARRGDWYETNYVLQYFPSNVTSGRITVTYDFKHMPSY